MPAVELPVVTKVVKVDWVEVEDVDAVEVDVIEVEVVAVVEIDVVVVMFIIWLNRTSAGIWPLSSTPGLFGLGPNAGHARLPHHGGFPERYNEAGMDWFGIDGFHTVALLTTSQFPVPDKRAYGVIIIKGHIWQIMPPSQNINIIEYAGIREIRSPQLVYGLHRYCCVVLRISVIAYSV